jgi:hypothetical protein
MIRRSDLAIAEHIIDSSGAVRILTDGYRTSRRGRPANTTNLRLLLLGLYLSIAHGGKGTITAAHHTLTERIALDDQIRLGVRDAEDPSKITVTRTDLYNIETTLTTKLAYARKARIDGVPDDERDRRRQVIQQFSDAVMDVHDLGWNATTVAGDATGIWSWGRRVPQAHLDHLDGITRSDRTGDDIVGSPLPLGPDDADDGDIGAIAPDDDSVQSVGRRFDPDAAYGAKTSKEGRPERFYGYDEHTLVQIPAPGEPTDAIPPLIRRFEITAASTDIVDVTLDLIDRHPGTLTDIVIDRHYHYKAVDRWKRPLARRNIRQHHDLRSDEQGFTEAHRIRWGAGHGHCPGTPDDLGVIPQPGPRGTTAERARFTRRIQLREKYALNRHNLPDDNGTHRVMCPALAGKVGCPHRPGTEIAAMELGLPVVQNPPNPADDGEPLPKVCTQQTQLVTPPESVFKLQQQHYWGSPAWQAIYNRRTYVEGSYGNRKNTSTENVRRGMFQVFGLVWAHIVIALANASYNQRMLENWSQRHPDHPHCDHPLLARDTDDTTPIGFIQVTADEYARLLAARVA